MRPKYRSWACTSACRHPGCTRMRRCIQRNHLETARRDRPACPSRSSRKLSSRSRFPPRKRILRLGYHYSLRRRPTCSCPARPVEYCRPPMSRWRCRWSVRSRSCLSLQAPASKTPVPPRSKFPGRIQRCIACSRSGMRSPCFAIRRSGHSSAVAVGSEDRIASGRVHTRPGTHRRRRRPCPRLLRRSESWCTTSMAPTSRSACMSASPCSRNTGSHLGSTSLRKTPTSRCQRRCRSSSCTVSPYPTCRWRRTSARRSPSTVSVRSRTCPRTCCQRTTD